jgi:hypothetical protein
LDEALDALRAENAVIVSAPTPTTQRAVVTDPEGHRVELVERCSENQLWCPITAECASASKHLMKPDR